MNPLRYLDAYHLEKALYKARPWLPDALYLRLLYRAKTGRTLHLRPPRTMNEKIQWMKLRHMPRGMAPFTDKIMVKETVAAIIGPQYVVPLLRVWNTPDEITLDGLPESFVIKTSHGANNDAVAVCPRRDAVDLDALRAKMRAQMSVDLAAEHMEWSYEGIDRRIFAEAYLGPDIADYKFHCFNGVPDSVMVCTGRTGHQAEFSFYDRRGLYLPYTRTVPAHPAVLPPNLDEMFGLAARLAQGIPFVRVDLYNIRGRVFFGEYTFFPASGFNTSRTPEADLHLGSLIPLP